MYNKLTIWIRRNYDFSLREANGVIILIFLLLLFLALPFLLLTFYPDKTENTAKDKIKLDSLVAILKQNEIESKKEYENKYKEKYKNYSDSKEEKVIKFFNFNPNLIDKKAFITLGIKPYIADRIIKFRTKFKPFKIKTDLKKIYGFDTILFEKLHPYIDLPEKVESNFKTYTKTTEKEFSKPILVDINLADSAQFEKIYGIGAKLATRILKFRNKLGGFISLNQLKEIYGLDSSVISEISKKMILDKSFIVRKLNINTSTIDDLKSHPYIGYKFAKVIVAYSNAHSGIKNKEDLKNIKILDETDIEKMLPYIEF